MPKSCEVRPRAYIHDVLGPGGWLEQKLPGYKSRPEQLELANAFAGYLLKRDLYQEKAPTLFVSEAPCGIGKTYAYLIPLLLQPTPSRRRIVLSTAGIALQEQLVTRDIPRLLDLLQEPMRVMGNARPAVVLLKGLSNYVCAKAVNELSLEDRDRIRLPILQEAERHNNSCSVDDLPMPLTSEEKGLLTTTTRDCKRHECPHAHICIPEQRRKMATGVGNYQIITVTNHHYLAALRLFSKEFPAAGTFVLLDEAHEFSAVYRDTNTTRLELETIYRWARDLEAMSDEALCHERENPELILRGRKQLLRLLPLEQQLLVGSSPVTEGLTQPSLRSLYALGHVANLIHAICWPSRNNRFDERGLALVKVLREFDHEATTLGNLQHVTHHPSMLIQQEEGKTTVLHVEEPPPASWIRAAFSATLRVGDAYEPFYTSLGLSREPVLVNKYGDRTAIATGFQPMEYTASSPFQWSQQALLVFPEGHMTDLRGTARATADQLGKTAVELVLQSRGRALFCCSSWAAADAAVEALRRDTPYTVYSQKEMPKMAAIKAFSEDVSSVLVGTVGMWTGVDVPGEALSLLVIDRIPFRGGVNVWAEYLKLLKRDWFKEAVLTPAAWLLAQGVGRLIRSVSDRGVCVVLDPRLSLVSSIQPTYVTAGARAYGKVLAKTAFPRDIYVSSSLEDVGAFLE